MTSRASHQRQRLFRQGAAALSKYVASDAPLYACPICLRAYPESASDGSLLTLEDVPPRSQGSDLVVLTCRDCNSTAGHIIDAAAARRAEYRDFEAILLRKETGEYTHSVALDIGGNQVVANLCGGGDLVELQVVGAASHPTAVNSQQAYIREQAAQHGGLTEDIRICYSIKQFDRLAKLSDLKTAFLVAFAALGYRYVFDARVRPVREALLSAEEQIIPNDCFWLADPSGHSGRSLVLVHRPVLALLVRLDQALVWLPWISGPTAIYEWLDAQRSARGRVDCVARPLDWPHGLEMDLDKHTSRPENAG